MWDRSWTHAVSGDGLPEVDERASRRRTFAFGAGNLFETKECEPRCWTHVVSDGGLPEVDARVAPLDLSSLWRQPL